jgi:hypothetical protein
MCTAAVTIILPRIKQAMWQGNAGGYPLRKRGSLVRRHFNSALVDDVNRLNHGVSLRAACSRVQSSFSQAISRTPPVLESLRKAEKPQHQP